MKNKNTNMTSEVEVAACDSPARLCKSPAKHTNPEQNKILQ